jgi:clan AA aspartic protease (TIGR02281 family)
MRFRGLPGVALAFSMTFPAMAQTDEPRNREVIDGLMERLGIEQKASSGGRNAIRKALDELARERCDRTAIRDLGQSLEREGYRREAATALVRFSETCDGDAPSLRTAVNIFVKLSDYPEAERISTQLIALEPYHDNGYFLRAVARQRSGDYKKAIDDFSTAIELFGNKTKISSISYYNIARSYEKLGQHCLAITPIETWIALDPLTNDNSQARAMIADYQNKGDCRALASAPKTEKIPVARRGQTIVVQAEVNGVAGRFLLDTGATFVTLKASYAARAKVDIDRDSEIRLNTANGIALAHRGLAKTVKLRSLQAQSVAIVVQEDRKGTYGEGIDGLLGMSFLSRFQLVLDGQSVQLSAKTR